MTETGTGTGGTGTGTGTTAVPGGIGILPGEGVAANVTIRVIMITMTMIRTAVPTIARITIVVAITPTLVTMNREIEMTSHAILDGLDILATEETERSEETDRSVLKQ